MMECISSIAGLLENFTARSIQLHDDLANEAVDILTLGSGWTWSFLGPAAGALGLRTAFTTREGRNGSIPFTFDPESNDVEPFRALPDAQTIVIIFPLYSAQAAKRLVNGYISTRSESYFVASEKIAQGSARTRFILLGSAGIWAHSGPALQFAPLSSNDASGCRIQSRKKNKPHHPKQPRSPWYDRHSPVDKVPRSIAEDEFLAFNSADDPVETSVLCLAGLWGHGRSPRRYVGRIAPTKESLSHLGSVHLVHGRDVARAILAMHKFWNRAAGQRWLLTNERVYDLWDLVSRWGDAGEAGRDHAPSGPQPAWVQELIAESRSTPSSAVRGLPRTPEQLGMAQDSCEFWSTFELTPEVPWVD